MTLARDDFPILRQGAPFALLDSGASTQKPSSVIDGMAEFLRRDYANIHRGVYALSQRSTALYEGARRKVARWIHAGSEREIVFVRGTTEAINLVAQTFGRMTLRAGDEVLVSGLEHHSNIVPWQMLCESTGSRVRVIPVRDDGSLDLAAYGTLLTSKAKIVAVSHVSNALGTINPVQEMARMAHARGAAIVVDGAQAIAHRKVDVQALDADFYAFSAHKMYGPTGVGVLYGKLAHLTAMPPYQGGGDMIETVTFEKSTYKAPPEKFEAGTPDILGVVGLSLAIDYLEKLGFDAIVAHERDLMAYAHEKLSAIPGLRILGPSEKSGALSFVLDGVHPHDIATILDQCGVAIRAGHHCAQPLMDRFEVPATSRASFGVYNDRSDVDLLVAALGQVMEVFR